SPTTIHTAITAQSGSLSNGIVDVEIYDAGGAKVNQQYFSGQSIGSGHSAGYNVTWTPQAAGTYTVMVGVFGQNWSSTLFWSSNAATVSVS
ncbi:MAG: hypothetical protein JWO42_3010, partial [Chloroflexi bacterium]|nr:hypothetical protein [Chloroflexota bacterium]